MSTLLPIFSIVGTTAVGKSNAAVDLAKYFIEQNLCSLISIISADSRQIYQGLEILSGADIPQGFISVHDEEYCSYNFHQYKNIKIFGLSSIKVTQDWSVSQFREFARKIIETSLTRREIVIVVGGTGLYHDNILNIDPQLSVPPNLELREKVTSFSVAELQECLEKINPEKFTRMNNSDRNNSRRLIRAIEISLSEKPEENKIECDPLGNLDQVFFGLHISSEQLLEKIKQRVKIRFDSGAITEVTEILKNEKDLSPVVKSTLGFAELEEYILGEKTKEDCLESWTLGERQYSKRQLTWWKKQSNIVWFDKNEVTWFEQLKTTAYKLLTDNKNKSSYT